MILSNFFPSWQLACLVLLALTAAASAVALGWYVFLWSAIRRHLPKPSPNTIGFFHPFANDGGGGERVLWCAVAVVQRERPGARCVIFCGGELSPETVRPGTKVLAYRPMPIDCCP